jgi:tetratricopeptide (TPR) repeat protein
VLVSVLRAQKTKEQWVAEGDAHYRTMRYIEALAAFNQALRLDPGDMTLPYLKERVLHDGFSCSEEQYLAYVQELADIDKRLLIDPHEAHCYNQKSQMLNNLQLHDEALEAIERAIHLDPTNRTFYGFKGYILSEGGSWIDAIVVYDQLIEQAFRLDPDDYDLYTLRDIILGIFPFANCCGLFVPNGSSA